MKQVSISVLIVFILFVFSSKVFSQAEKELSTEQKVKDFEYLYTVLKDNYPYFGVGMRSNGIDWLSKKNEYLDLIKKTGNDSAYVFTLNSVLTELGNGHVDLSFVEYWDSYKDLYKNIAINYPEYKKWAIVLEDPIARPSYWGKLLKNKKKVVGNEENVIKRKPRPVFGDSILDNDKIGILRIPSFGMDRIKKDSAAIISFLDKIKTYDHLIIDIQGNGGGATLYWEENLVRKLIQDTIIYPQYLVIKNGELNKIFFPQYFEDSEIIKKTDKLPNIPSELLDGTFCTKIEMDTIIPDYTQSFKGKIYVLVDDVVFSSAEGFAYFCKATNWATIAGQQTGGDGVGSDPIPFILPESGIIVRYPALSGFNLDGSLNFEEKTKPDIPIEGKDRNERLSKLIEYIRAIN